MGCPLLDHRKTQRCLQLLSDPGLRDAKELCSRCKAGALSSLVGEFTGAVAGLRFGVYCTLP